MSTSGTGSTMRFGFGLYPYDRLSFAETVAVVKRADELGYYAVTFPEHLLPPTWADRDLRNRTWYDIPTLAAFLAAETHSIRFYMNVLVLPYYHPVRLAKALATLDVASNGRVIAGIGAGWLEDEFERLGIPFAERGAMTDEYLRAVLELWTSDAPSFAGRYLSFSDVSFFPKPLQRPHIPLIIGGTGPKPFRRAGLYGDGWAPSVGTFEDFADGIATIRRLVAEAGRDPDRQFFGSGFAVGVQKDAAQAARRHAGLSEEQSTDAQQTADEPGLSAAESIEQVRRFQEVGCNYLSVGFAWEGAADLSRELARFAEEVMPAFR